VLLRADSPPEAWREVLGEPTSSKPGRSGVISDTWEICDWSITLGRDPGGKTIARPIGLSRPPLFPTVARNGKKPR
jgi:hypothetical protein